MQIQTFLVVIVIVINLAQRSSCAYIYGYLLHNPIPDLELTASHLMPVRQLQELCAKNGFKNPEYRLVKTEDNSHSPLFTIKVFLNDIELSEGIAKSKKAAKNIAAKKALIALREEGVVEEKQDWSKIKSSDDEQSDETVDSRTEVKNVSTSDGSGDHTNGQSAGQRNAVSVLFDLMESLHVRHDLEPLFEAKDNSDYCFRFNMIAEKLNCLANYIPLTEDKSRTNKYKCLLQMRCLSAGQPINKRVTIFSSWGNSQDSLEQAMQKAAKKAISMVKVLKM